MAYLNFNGFRFKDFPAPLTYDTYESVRSEVASALFEMRGVESVFCCGSTSAPGISDLDFFVTVDPSVFDKQKLVEFYGALDGPTRYTAGHHYRSWHRPGGNRDFIQSFLCPIVSCLMESTFQTMMLH